MSAEKELIGLSIMLDCNEYDDEEEFESVLQEYYPDKVIEVAKRAALEGAITGMHLYGYLLARKAAKLKEADEEYMPLLVEAREWVKNAAKNGCWGAMDDLATEQTELFDVPIEEQIAFFKLSGSGGDLNEHITYLKEFCSEEVTPDQLNNGLKLYEELVKYAEENGITQKRMCECIFP